MEPGILLLLLCVLALVLTAVLCIAFYIKRTQIWVREDEDYAHTPLFPHWLRSRNYQTMPDLEAGPDNNNNNSTSTDNPQSSQQQDTTIAAASQGQGSSRLPRHPPPRTYYNWHQWDPEDGAIGVRYSREQRERLNAEQQQQQRVLGEETARQIEEFNRRMEQPSPYDVEAALYRGGSEPVDTPCGSTKRPIFPLPAKLIWQKLNTFERAGSVWWRN